MAEHIIIQQEQCIGCGLCPGECPLGSLRMENGKAVLKPEALCIACGHCYAVCPRGAVSMPGFASEDTPVTPMESLPAEQLLRGMKSRRSIRQFTGRPVEAEKTDMILEAGRYCPTGGNSQNVHYTILGSRQQELEAECVKLFRTGKKLGSAFSGALKSMEIGEDFFFKGAPLVIVVSGTGSTDAALAASYMELMAESLGLGVLYSGFFIACTRMSGKIRRVLALPKGYKAALCMVIGYPAVKYKRIPPRKPLKLQTL